MERQVSTHDIHKIVDEDFVELHKRLVQSLGDMNPFAKFSIGRGFYVWSDNRYSWRQMITASSLEQEIVRATLYELKKSIAAIIGEQSTEKLSTVPDDSHIYYNSDGDDIKILLTGWGFVKPARVIGKSDIEELRKSNPVSLSFSLDGEKLPCYEFGVQLPKQVKHLRTNLDGVYQFKDLGVGEKFTLIDFQTNKSHVIQIVEGQSLYDIDVTSYSAVTIYAQEGDEPIANEPVEIIYRDKTHNVTTDAYGYAYLQLPYAVDSNIIATLRDQTKVEAITTDGNKISFIFAGQHQTDIEVYVVANGEPVANKEVVINYGEMTFNGTTNSNGTFFQRVTFNPEWNCNVAVNGFAPQSRQLADTDINYFRFEQEDSTFAPHIVVVNEKGGREAGYPIKVDIDGKATSHISDENGIVQLPNIVDGTDMLVVDEINQENYTVYKLYSSQPEYIFRVDRNLDIKVTILDQYQRPVKCQSVSFFQKNTNIEKVCTLDSNGSTLFATDTFIKHNEIDVALEGSEKEYGPIVFSLEDNEYEYILQEEKTKTPWRNIVLQTLTILGMVAAATAVWFGSYYGGKVLYYLIYN